MQPIKSRDRKPKLLSRASATKPKTDKTSKLPITKTKIVKKVIEKFKKPLTSQNVIKKRRIIKPAKTLATAKPKPKQLEGKICTLKQPTKTTSPIKKSKFGKQESGVIKHKIRGPPVLMSITYLDTDISKPSTTRPHQILDRYAKPKVEKESRGTVKKFKPRVAPKSKVKKSKLTSR